ncbi:MAG: hypothetical protein Q8K65_04080 [Alphaproteobacteria bacterium]|nr:hypothetical protein [Alphaproteobacteria bacterium]
MQDKPDDTTAGQAARAPDAAAASAVPPSPNWWQRTGSGIARRARICKNFTRELLREHEFWVHALAVKGGASAIVVSAVLAVSYVVAAPFMLAAAGIAACGAVVGLGIYGITAGSMRSWYRLRKIYSNVTGKPLPPKPDVQKPNWVQRQCEKPGIKKLLETKAVKGFLNTRMWKMSRKLAVGQQDNLLGGLAVGGAVLSLALGAAALATQILVLPVVAVGGLVVGGAVLATSYLISGISGLYFGIVGIRHMREKKRAKAAALAAVQAQNAAEPLPEPEEASPMPATAAAAMPATANDAFGKAAQKDVPAKAAPEPPAAVESPAPRKNVSGPKA